jgi:LuxR family maltose regulon positive regulatory protein
MISTLLKTKLYRPLVRPELVLRPNLIKRLDEGLNSKVIMVSAPAGYGKTTLVSAWVSQCKIPVAWLSLDEDDNHPARLLSYLIAAAQTIQPNLGQAILSILQSPQPPAILNLLPTLINELDDIQARFVLVLDDYHLVTSPEVHKAIAFLIEHQPPQMNLTITTRIDPPLPLAHLRGRGQLTELRQADLRFSKEETIAFLKYAAGIELSPEDVDLLVNRTEGWIAGLQMAALSMRNKKDISTFIVGFRGSHEYIVDYFASEILTNLPESVKSFLLKTSFLDQLCGSLCDTVTAQTDSQQILERLQEENLFLVPLDDEHIWYRYHQLFADFLHKNLKHNYPMELPQLHLRASQWFEHNEFPHQAVEHAFLAEDYPRAARLLEAVAEPVIARGDHLWLLKEIEKLPKEQMDEHLRLGILQATILISNGILQRAEEALQKIEARMGSHLQDISTQDYVNARIVALRAMLAVQRIDAENAKQYARLALSRLPRGTRNEAPWRADSLLALGLSNIALGDLAEARQNLDLAIEEASFAGNPYTFLYVTAVLAEVLWSQGCLKEAIERCQAGLKFIDENNLGWAPMSGEVLIRWCLLMCERGDLGQAEDYLNRGIELIRRGGEAWALAWAYHMKMFYCIARGDLLAADTAGQETDQLPQFTALPVRVVSGISALKVLIWVRLRRLDEAEEYLKKRGVKTGTKIRYPYHREYQSLAALLIAIKDFLHAETILDELIDWAEGTKQNRTLICAWVLRSMAYAAQKDIQKALKCLSLALDLAEPEGYFQAILEVGQPVIPLLYEAVQRGIHPEFAARLIDAYKENSPISFVTTDTQKYQSEVLSPLRPREIEVLKLVADGRTNKEIAQELHISLRTVKFHMTCILTKLGADNRMQAVTRAKILGIVQ